MHLFIRPVRDQLDEGVDIFFLDTEIFHFSTTHFYFDNVFGIEARRLFHRFLESWIILLGEI